LITGLALVVAGIAAQVFAWRLGWPPLLPLLVFGLVAGPGLQWLAPLYLLGPVYGPLLSLTLVVLCLDRALAATSGTLPSPVPPWRLGLVTPILVTLALTGMTHWALRLSLSHALLVATALAAITPEAAATLLRGARARPDITASALQGARLGSAVVALGLLLVLQCNALWQRDPSITTVVRNASLGLAVSIALGWVSARLLAALMRRGHISAHLEGSTVIGVCLLAFALVARLGPEHAYFLPLTLGAVLGRQRGLRLHRLRSALGQVHTIALTALVPLVAAQAEWPTTPQLRIKMGALIVVTLVAVQPLCALMALSRTALRARARTFLALFAPRGALPLLAVALAPQLVSIPAEQLSVLHTFTVLFVGAALLLHTATSWPLAAVLRVRRMRARGVLLIGAHTLARRLAAALTSKGLRVVLLDDQPAHLERARRGFLPVIEGSLPSEEVLQQLQVDKLGTVIALSGERERDRLAIDALHPLIADCYQLPSAASAAQDLHPHAAPFGNNLDFDTLYEHLAQGYRLTFLAQRSEDVLLDPDDRSIPLLALSPTGRLRILPEQAGDMSADDALLVLCPPASANKG
ncbi:MAG: NAD-binding protein, partial [Polyangiales bacterium]